MIIFDASHAIIASTAMASKNFGVEGVKVSDVRTYFFTLVANVKKKFGAEYGSEVVFAFDSREGYWRKEKFPYYKIKRKETKANAPFSYEFANECIDVLFDEINNQSHYKAVRVNGAEGDDVIAALVKKYCPLKDEIVNPYEQKRILIISTDGDMVQLQNRQGVDQYSTTQEKHIRDENPRKALFEKIVRGDTGDSIPSALTPDDHFTLVDRPRQKQIRETSINEWWDTFNSTGVHNETYSTYYDRNKLLIDFDEIPPHVESTIIEAFENAPVQTKTDFMNYVTANKMHPIIDQLQFL